MIITVGVLIFFILNPKSKQRGFSHMGLGLYPVTYILSIWIEYRMWMINLECRFWMVTGGHVENKALTSIQNLGLWEIRTGSMTL